MIKICARCGGEFEANHGLTKYCAPCRHDVDCESDAHYRATHPKPSKSTNISVNFKPKIRTCTSCDKSGKTLDDWAREADDCNLDYGTYRALIAAGRTFEQLKAERRSPQFHSHCRVRKTF